MKRYILALLALICAVSMSAKTYVVAVGIADYKYISDLYKTENDARLVAELFKTHTKSVITITGAGATKATVLKALNDQFSRAGENDQIIFFFSGHGYDNGFCLYDTKSPSNGLSYDEIYKALRMSKAKRKYIFADACHSGGLRKSKKGKNPKSQTDIMLFLSCRNNESSIERRDMENGFFTHYLALGLRGKADVNRDRKITCKELFDYVNPNVAQVSNGRQHPVMWGKFRDNMTIIEW